MEEKDKICCWVKVKTIYMDTEYRLELGCVKCSNQRSVMFVHKTNPRSCGCGHEEETLWRNMGYLSTMWPTCVECIESIYDIIEETGEDLSKFYFNYTVHKCVLAKKPPPRRNAKKAYK